jgi:hypothetical protein
MNELEKKLLQETVGKAEPRLCLKTKTKVDAGRWWMRSPLWLCVADDKLVLLAVARRCYVQVVQLSDCLASDYCHAAGELVLKPVEGVEFDHIAMSPADALKVLGEVRESALHGLQGESVV